MKEMLLPFFAYVFVTTFTPGPNNITSTSMGMNYGYRTALRYIMGIATGFIVIMFLCGLLTGTITRVFPKVEIVLRVLGAGYMVWLAVTILRSTKASAADIRKTAAFRRGFTLQIVNPKVIVYGITVFSGFLTAVVHSLLTLFAASLFLTFFAFLSTSAWALFGSVIKKYLQHRTIRVVFNIAMALLLLYSAASIAGVHHILH